MDTIENKIEKLQELSKKQKSINETKQDMADILGNSKMEDKIQIAKTMSKIETNDENQEKNLGFIIPHLIKELYGPEINITTPIKEQIKEQIVETKPIQENKNTDREPVEEENLDAVVIEGEDEDEPEPKQKKKGIIARMAERIQVVPGFDIHTPKVISEAEIENKPEEEKSEIKENIEEKEIKIEKKEEEIVKKIIEPKQKSKQKKKGIIARMAERIQVVPGFDIHTPKVISEAEIENKPEEEKSEIKENIEEEEKEIKIEKKEEALSTRKEETKVEPKKEKKPSRLRRILQKLMTKKTKNKSKKELEKRQKAIEKELKKRETK